MAPATLIALNVTRIVIEMIRLTDMVVMDHPLMIGHVIRIVMIPLMVRTNIVSIDKQIMGSMSATLQNHCTEIGLGIMTGNPVIETTGLMIMTDPMSGTRDLGTMIVTLIVDHEKN